MKKVKGVVEIISLLFSLVIVAYFIYKAISAERYLDSAIILIVFLMLMKISNIDYFKITKSSLEVKDEKDDKNA